MQLCGLAKNHKAIAVHGASYKGFPHSIYKSYVNRSYGGLNCTKKIQYCFPPNKTIAIHHIKAYKSTNLCF